MKEITKAIESLMNANECMIREPDKAMLYIDYAIRDLRAAQEQEKPLTLEEIREMEGEPVWFVDLDDLFDEWRILESVWSDDISSEYEWQANSSTMSTDYGEKWLAYRSRPEKGTNNG